MGVDFYAHVGFGVVLDQRRQPWDAEEYGGDFETWLHAQYQSEAEMPPVELDRQGYASETLCWSESCSYSRNERVIDLKLPRQQPATEQWWSAKLIEFCDRHRIDTKGQQPRWLLFGRISA